MEVKLQNGVSGRGTGMYTLREDRAGGTSPKYGGREEGFPGWHTWSSRMRCHFSRGLKGQMGVFQLPQLAKAWVSNWGGQCPAG